MAGNKHIETHMAAKPVSEQAAPVRIPFDVIKRILTPYIIKATGITDINRAIKDARSTTEEYPLENSIEMAADTTNSLTIRLNHAIRIALLDENTEHHGENLQLLHQRAAEWLLKHDYKKKHPFHKIHNDIFNQSRASLQPPAPSLVVTTVYKPTHQLSILDSTSETSIMMKWNLDVGEIPKDMRLDLIDALRATPTPTQQLDTAIHAYSHATTDKEKSEKLEIIQQLAQVWLKEDRHHLFEYKGLQQPVKNLLRRVDRDLLILKQQDAIRTDPQAPDQLAESLQSLEKILRAKEQSTEWNRSTGILEMRALLDTIRASDKAVPVDPINTFIQLQRIAHVKSGAWNTFKGWVGRFFKPFTADHAIGREERVSDIYHQLAETRLTKEGIEEFKNFIDALSTRIGLENEQFKLDFLTNAAIENENLKLEA